MARFHHDLPTILSEAMARRPWRRTTTLLYFLQRTSSATITLNEGYIQVISTTMIIRAPTSFLIPQWPLKKDDSKTLNITKSLSIYSFTNRHMKT